MLTFHDYLDLFPLVERLPFYDYGFGWLIPAAVGGVIGALLSKPVGKDAPSSSPRPNLSGFFSTKFF